MQQYSLGIVIGGKFILSHCLFLIDLWVALPPPFAHVLLDWLDKVTYSQMIYIFLTRLSQVIGTDSFFVETFCHLSKKSLQSETLQESL